MPKLDLATDLALALDPVALAGAVDIRPDPWQRDILRSDARRILLNGCRQSGKSTMTALLAVHSALFEADSLVLLMSPTLRQSQELFRKAIDIHHAVAGAEQTEAESSLRLELTNGSRIVSLPGQEATVRGFSGVRLLAVDEAARVPNELYYSIRPMLAVSGGRLIALSTPGGTRGWWYEAWCSSEPWERYEVPAEVCPRISPAFLAEERGVLGDWWYEQEYECRFHNAATQPFHREDIEAAFDPTLEPWDL